MRLEEDIFFSYKLRDDKNMKSLKEDNFERTNSFFRSFQGYNHWL